MYKNVHYNEYLYSPSDYYQHDGSRRNVFTWIPRDEKDEKFVWNFEFVYDNVYHIKNVKYGEYLYSPIDGFKYDNNRRRVFTWKNTEFVPKGEDRKFKWEITTVGNDVFIVNYQYNEHLYASVDHFNYKHLHELNGDRRSIFTWGPHSGIKEERDVWKIEDCRPQVRRVKRYAVNQNTNNGSKIFDEVIIGDKLYKHSLKVDREERSRYYSDINKTHLSRKLLSIEQPEVVASSGARPSSWINDLFGWITSSIGGLLGSKYRETPSTSSIILQVDAQKDINGTILLLDMLIRKVTGRKYISTVDQSISPLEAQGYALNITNRFEKVLNNTAIKSGISLTNLNLDPVAVQSAIVRKIINGRFSEIAKTLYSFAKEAYPEFKQTDKFLVHLRSQLEGEKVLQQKVEKPYKDLSQEVSRKVELSKKPDTFLNGTSVVKGISRGIN
ncbi:RICIN domain-containing protein [Wolbachia pipientis]|uniref:RICIN domain-containing protein n=1 Tax=Wolbachia pipientis TaxID=955 RepID=UPI0020B83571|nr:latrotoxin-related protein [Wolbachia pipientis]